MRRFLSIIIIFSIIVASPALGAKARKPRKAQKITDAQFLEICRNGTEQEIIKALKSGANPNAKENVFGSTALMWAIDNNYPEAVKALIRANANVNARDKLGRTALMLLLDEAQPNVEFIKILLKAGADVNAKDDSGTYVIMWAVLHTPEIMNIILKAGAKLNVLTNSGSNVLMEAVKGENPEIVKMLIKEGINVNAKNKDGMTALMYAARDSNKEVINILIDAGADDVTDNDGRTALIYAALVDSPDNVNALIDAGAYVKARDKNGKMAIDYARENDKLKGSDALKRLEELSK